MSRRLELLGLVQIRWVRTPSGRLGHALIEWVHPAINLKWAAGGAYCFGPSYYDEMPIGVGICMYGAKATLPAERLPECLSCSMHLSGLEQAIGNQLAEPLLAAVYDAIEAGDPAARRLLTIALDDRAASA